MTIRLPIAALTAMILATGAAEAAPKLAGTYTMTDNEICQATGAGALPSDRGSITQGLATVTVAADKMTFVGLAQNGRLVVAGTEKLTRSSFTETQTFKISGKANPFVVTLIKANGKSKAFKAHFDEIDAQGVVGQMVLLASFANGTTAANCVTQMIFLSH